MKQNLKKYDDIINVNDNKKIFDYNKNLAAELKEKCNINISSLKNKKDINSIKKIISNEIDDNINNIALNIDNNFQENLPPQILAVTASVLEFINLIENL